MKRFLASALVLGSFSMFALAGCDSGTTKVETGQKVTGPDGTREIKKTEEIKETGKNPPADPVKAPDAPSAPEPKDPK